MSKIKIAPSMMCVNFLDVKSELDVFKQFDIDLLHVDIMDGRYVPNFTLGIDFAKSLVSYSDIPLDFHLMVEDVDNYLDIFCSIPGSIVTFHPETSRHPVRTIQRIRQAGCKPGLAIDPALPIDSLKHLLPLVDQVCVMSVNPGYAGQPLLAFCIDKIKEVRYWLNKFESNAEIEIDGNVSWDNIPGMIEAGAEILVVGTSSVLGANQDRVKSMSRLKSLLSTISAE
ncbi:ribulose-phosphate 3-epimerase [Mucilaginibacter hurinus]|uniref:Ribulose-phosphate 3-epimerase n=1 Tax=Mucilaginibacter hurinus TaxID=2201324 RepID=A0A367GR51_9SPHI|nr:ribulose-phosphate 3-epimerase [Mucilaginibacter hurinus]RCH55346.1 ribulose-phosphate 3-epimerase [Mucilaginibacter hurinus]